MWNLSVCVCVCMSVGVKGTGPNLSSTSADIVVPPDHDGYEGSEHDDGFSRPYGSGSVTPALP